MRKPFTIAVALIAVAIFAEPALAGPIPALALPPEGFTCSFASVTAPNDTVQCSWDALEGAKKYSVDVVANYELAPPASGTMSADFDFGTTETEISIPLNSFPTDINGDGFDDTLLSLVLRVKGLAPPGRQAFNQHNPFSATVTCDISLGNCSP